MNIFKNFAPPPLQGDMIYEDLGGEIKNQKAFFHP